MNSVYMYLEEAKKCNKPGSGSREGLMRDELDPGLGPQDTKKSRAYRLRRLALAQKVKHNLDLANNIK